MNKGNQSMADSLAPRVSAVSEPSPMPKSLILQNVTLGPHFVSDLKLTWGPLEVIDLTWEDPLTIQKSKDLRNSIRKGLLREITREQWEEILERQAAKERAELLRKQKSGRTRNIDVDGKSFEADSFDAASVGKNNAEVSTAGYANDSLTYAVAFDIAQTEAELRGELLMAEDFAARVEADPNYINRLMSVRNASVSGDPRRGNAYVAQPPSAWGQSTSVQPTRMTNLNNDGYIAGANAAYAPNPLDHDPEGDWDDNGIADEIDLTGEINSEEGPQEKGSVKRKK